MSTSSSDAASPRAAAADATPAAAAASKAPRCLSVEQVEHFRTHGYVVVDQLKSAAECDALRDEAARLVDAFDPAEHGARNSVFSTRDQQRTSDDYFLGSGERVRFFFEEGAVVDGRMTKDKQRAINKFGHNMHDLVPAFSRFSRDSKIAALVADLGFVRPQLLQSMYIYKQPHIGGAVRTHQDKTFLYTDSPLLGVWIALEDACIDNACLYALPGSHRDERGLRARFRRTRPFVADAGDNAGAAGDDAGAARTRLDTLDATPFDESRMVPVEVRKGSAVLIDGLLAHMSHENKSDRTRQAYTLHVVDNTYDEYPRDNWLQRPTMPARGFELSDAERDATTTAD